MIDSLPDNFGEQRGRPYRIVAVCLGNICRSPIAEVVLRDRIASAGLGRRVVVESAGTGGWHVGKPADHRAQAVLGAHGYDTEHAARQFDPAWFAEVDLIVGMDYNNVLDVRGMAPEQEAAVRVRILRSFDPALMHLPEDDPQLEVPDPYYDDAAAFGEVLAMIEDAVDGVVDHVRLELS